MVGTPLFVTRTLVSLGYREHKFACDQLSLSPLDAVIAGYQFGGWPVETHHMSEEQHMQGLIQSISPATLK